LPEIEYFGWMEEEENLPEEELIYFSIQGSAIEYEEKKYVRQCIPLYNK
jgi:hypothetical protein